MQIHYVILGSMGNNLLEEIVERKQMDDLQKQAQRWYIAAKSCKKLWWVSLSFFLSKLCEEDKMNSGDQGGVFIEVWSEFPRKKCSGGAMV